MDNESYKPVSCSFHDQLEAFASKKMFVEVHYFSEIHEYLRAQAVIKDVFNENGEEFIKLNTGEKIRLDRIVRVDDVIAPGYEHFYDFSCDC